MGERKRQKNSGQIIRRKEHSQTGTACAAFGERHCNYARQMRIKVLFEKGLGRGKRDAHPSLLLILYSLAYVRRQQVGPGTARSEKPSPQRSPTFPNVSYSVTSMGASASQAGRRTESLVRVQFSPFLKESSASRPD